MVRFLFYRVCHVRHTVLFHNYPLVPLALSLIAGISVGHGLLSHATTAFWFAVIYGLIVACWFVRRHPRLQTLLLLSAVFSLGGLLINMAEDDYTVVCPEEEADYEAVVASEPEKRGRVLRFDMIVTSGPYSGHIVRASLLKDTATCRYREITVGDGIVARSTITPPHNFRDAGFDYVTYLKANGISGQTFIYYRNWAKSSVDIDPISTVRRARLVFLRYRHNLITRYRALGLDGQTMAVVSAMTLGYRSEISPELRETYSRSGVSHILALSGMHLGIIYFLLTTIFFGTRFTILREVLIVILIWTYVFLVGMPVSVVRSAIMISAFSFAVALEHDRTSLNVLAIAALSILVVSPFSLYDVGFQLSFLSVAAILTLSRPIHGLISAKFLGRHRILSWFWSLVTMSCCAQLATAPLVAHYFGTVSFVFLPANIVAVPAVTVILYLSLTALAVWLIPAVQHLVVSLLIVVVTGLNDYLLWLSSLPCASLSGLHVNIPQTVCLYVIIVALGLLCKIIYRRHFYTVLSM